MNSLKIEATANTPEITFDIDNSKLTLFKVSKPENAFNFYEPLFEFIKNFEIESSKSDGLKKLVIDFKYEYFNTATIKIIYDLLERLKELIQKGIEIKINWYYHPDDEDMLEDGQIMSDATGIPFNFIATE
ncbi:MAG: hypothetical protein A2X13_10300 [Bacteroidetes bacterium GWC2_33_15]|nr:MAG: hypothetical protein A2X10_02855 [Bacteroidetes bacterium GWA2_33_15]OFX48795.1 MAG: hypothetical protein A2X13_10300 [Bacteroidetes bacterium GWC2_33_15]OFX66037.1 MAG: hypothetical protein A2X15_11450 [Bacteroidetes bacterium GWB2_32_14]OFX68201.1 MAG: hypothetical protein A2X14_07445 [Bacteroidetes bacterium GWD2_33_33]HAN17977.1 hypothetical protein [Bacteroidales bacterium]